MYMYTHIYICKHLYNIYGLSDQWDASHQLSLSPGPWLASNPSWSQLLPYSSTNLLYEQTKIFGKRLVNLEIAGCFGVMLHADLLQLVNSEIVGHSVCRFAAHYQGRITESVNSQ